MPTAFGRSVFAVPGRDFVLDFSAFARALDVFGAFSSSVFAFDSTRTLSAFALAPPARFAFAFALASARARGRSCDGEGGRPGAGGGGPSS